MVVHEVISICDAKQFTGLTHCQVRNKETLSFAFNASLTSVNLARAFARLHWMELFKRTFIIFALAKPPFRKPLFRN